jgi:predicted secreted protein
MKKTLKFIIVFVIAFTITLAANWWIDNRYYYSFGENDEFNLEVGETFVVKLDINGSTGSNNCFLKDVTIAKLINKEYTPGLHAKLGYDGSGGIMAYTFKAVKPGIDTIKIANCPLVFENKSCEDYNDKNTEPGNVFIVNVSK